MCVCVCVCVCVCGGGGGGGMGGGGGGGGGGGLHLWGRVRIVTKKTNSFKVASLSILIVIIIADI